MSYENLAEDLAAGIVVIFVMVLAVRAAAISYLKHPSEIWELITKK